MTTACERGSNLIKLFQLAEEWFDTARNDRTRNQTWSQPLLSEFGERRTCQFDEIPHHICLGWPDLAYWLRWGICNSLSPYTNFTMLYGVIFSENWALKLSILTGAPPEFRNTVRSARFVADDGSRYASTTAFGSAEDASSDDRRPCTSANRYDVILQVDP